MARYLVKNISGSPAVVSSYSGGSVSIAVNATEWLSVDAYNALSDADRALLSVVRRSSEGDTRNVTALPVRIFDAAASNATDRKIDVSDADAVGIQVSGLSGAAGSVTIYGSVYGVTTTHFALLKTVTVTPGSEELFHIGSDIPLNSVKVSVAGLTGGTASVYYIKLSSSEGV